MKLHDLMLCPTILQDLSWFLQIEFAFSFTGLIHAFFNCSHYTFHENSTEVRGWERSRFLCQNSSEGDLVSIEEKEERNFVKNIIKNLTAINYFIGLRRTMENANGWAIKQQSIHHEGNSCGPQVNPVNWNKRFIAQPFMVNIGTI